MRVFLLGGAAVIAVAAATVPLPWSVSDPSVLHSAVDVVTIELSPELEQQRGARTVSGEYLAVQQGGRATAVQLLTAAVAPSGRIAPAAAPPSRGDVAPLVAATMSGLGIVPRFADVAEIPVDVQVEPGADASAVGTALYAFDVGNDLDVARGRRVVGLGRMIAGGHLVCTVGVADAVVAAAAEQVDVVVVPSDCAEDAVAAIPHDAQLEVLEASTLSGAADALLAP